MKLRAIKLASVTTLIAISCSVAVGCGKSEPKKSLGDSLADSLASSMASSIASSMASAEASASASAAAAAAAAPKVEVSADMKGFMAMLVGEDKSTGKALTKYAAKGQADNDIGMYSLREATVSKVEKAGALTCYTMESKAGMMDHTSRICWNDKGKIAEIKDSSH
jgi:hypothetical protein